MDLIAVLVVSGFGITYIALLAMERELPKFGRDR